MKQPRLDSRHRDKTAPMEGQIKQKRGDTLNRKLPKPISRFRGDTKLATMRKATGETSIEKVRQVVERPHGDWAVRNVGSDRATKVFSSQKEAISFARDMSRREGATHLYIHSRDGSVREKATYGGRDPSVRISKR